MDEHGRALWRRATTLAELGELTAQWAEGRLRFMPTDADEPYDETAELIPVLAALNRNGLMTTFSQPAVELSDDYGQRAAVAGFCSESVARRIKDRVARTDVVFWAVQSGTDVLLPVTIDEGQPSAWVGVTTDPSSEYADACNNAALSALESSLQFAAFDPVWGRREALWAALCVGLEIEFPGLG